MTPFGVHLNPIYGTGGEFSIPNGNSSIRVKYLMTKMQPGSQGKWSNILASQMVPWREVFKVEHLSFDELLQRDLDDSRVAHELIPYLLGSTGASARFFPPILAVIVPRDLENGGILPYYPAKDEDGNISAYGDLMKIQDSIVYEGAKSPFSSISFNSHQSAFVIADGQHRAMAVLALHRQLNDSWKDDPYASFYRHIAVTPNMVKNIELPVCIAYFPDLDGTNEDFKTAGLNLKKVCRELFIVVNRHAKPVSRSREIMLDDEDFAAALMRRTLSKFKDRPRDKFSFAQICAISYGDSGLGKQVAKGIQYFSTAVAIHKLHCALSFGMATGFKLRDQQDLSDGRNVRNSNRPPVLLLGTDYDNLASLARTSSSMPQNKREKIVDLLGSLNDIILYKMFDELKPFSVHNSQMATLRENLNEPSSKADKVQAKCLNLIFEGSGGGDVFSEHRSRLVQQKEDLQAEGKTPSDALGTQILFAKSVEEAIRGHFDELQRKRACRLFNLDYEYIYESKGTKTEDEDIACLEETGRSFFETISTQAFQMGFVMAVASVVEEIAPANIVYSKRVELLEGISSFFIKTLNNYFGGNPTSKKQKVTGFIKKPEAQIFNSRKYGLRGLYRMSTNEINERSWPFFRYLILELVHCQSNKDMTKEFLDNSDWISQEYLKVLPNIVDDMIETRDEIIESAIKMAIKNNQAQREMDEKIGAAKSKGDSEDQLSQLKSRLETEIKDKVLSEAKTHLKASLGVSHSKHSILARIGLLTLP